MTRSRLPFTIAPRKIAETFVIDHEGLIAFKPVGPITSENLEKVPKPAIDKVLANIFGFLR